MAITPISDASNSSGSLPWLNDWLKENKKPKAKEFLIVEVHLASSGKGYRVVCDCFQAWLWKNSKLTNQFIEGLNYYVDNPESGYACFLVITNIDEASFTIGVDKEVRLDWFSKKNGCFTTLKPDTDLITCGENMNPFL